MIVSIILIIFIFLSIFFYIRYKNSHNDPISFNNETELNEKRFDKVKLGENDPTNLHDIITEDFKIEEIKE